jgi:DnaJ-class molecular chaperone
VGRSLRKKSILVHPDKCAQESEEKQVWCADQFMLLQKAKEALTNPFKKQMYDCHEQTNFEYEEKIINSIELQKDLSKDERQAMLWE